jgi:hypothetical protein
MSFILDNNMNKGICHNLFGLAKYSSVYTRARFKEDTTRPDDENTQKQDTDQYQDRRRGRFSGILIQQKTPLDCSVHVRPPVLLDVFLGTER